MKFLIHVFIWISLGSLIIYVSHFYGSYMSVFALVFMPILFTVQVFFRSKRQIKYSFIQIFMAIEVLFVFLSLTAFFIEKDFSKWFAGILIPFQVGGGLIIVVALLSDILLNAYEKDSETKGG
jgi:hypothetical protein